MWKGIQEGVRYVAAEWLTEVCSIRVVHFPPVVCALKLI